MHRPSFFRYHPVVGIMAGILGLVASAHHGTLGATFPVGASPPITLSHQHPSPSWKINAMAPAITVVNLHNIPIHLKAFRDHPVVLFFGSITDPTFRNDIKEANWLATVFHGKAAMVLIYTRESHPAGTPSALTYNQTTGFNFPEPREESARIKLAALAVKRLPIRPNIVVAVDSWSNTTTRQYGDLPDMAFLIDQTGHLAAAYPWFNGSKLSAAIRDLLANRPVRQRDAGAPFTIPPPRLALHGDSLPPGNPGVIADTLDGMHLSVATLKQLLPAITEFSSALRTFMIDRRTAAKADGHNSGRHKLRHDLHQLRHAAILLKDSLRRHLTAPEYHQVMQLLDRGKLARLFNDSN